MATQEQQESTFVVCLICLKRLKRDVRLEKCSKCAKEYHRNCIFRWLRTHHVPNCPHCRADMSELLNSMRSSNQPIQQTRQNNAINNYDLMNDDEPALERDFGSTCPCS